MSWMRSEKVISHLTKTLVVGSGGGGNSIMARTIPEVANLGQEGLKFCAVNTDGQALNLHYGPNSTIPGLNELREAKRFFDFPLSKKGLGTGGNPEIARAMALERSAEIEEFIKEYDSIFFTAGLGNGTGTGATPVFAEIAHRLGKTVFTYAAMPTTREARKIKPATEALRQLMSFGPVVTVRNSSITKYLEGMTDEKKKRRLTPKGYFKITDENSIIPGIKSNLEMNQKPGDAKNIDQNDFTTLCRSGDHSFVRVASYTRKQINVIKAEEVVTNLTTSIFLDDIVIKYGSGAILWIHGPWPAYLYEEILDKLQTKILGPDNPNKKEHFYFDYGMLEDVDDRVFSMGLTVVARKEHTLFQNKEIRVIPAMIGGVLSSLHLPPDLAARFDILNQSSTASLEEYVALYNKIEEAAGIRPDLPPRHRPVVLDEAKPENNGLLERWRH